MGGAARSPNDSAQMTDDLQTFGPTTHRTDISSDQGGPGLIGRPQSNQLSPDTNWAGVKRKHPLLWEVTSVECRYRHWYSNPPVGTCYELPGPSQS
jgi:hypothetical protein